MKTENKYSPQRPNLTVIDGGRTGLTLRRQKMSSVNSIGGRKAEILAASSVEPSPRSERHVAARDAAATQETERPRIKSASEADFALGSLMGKLKNGAYQQEAMDAVGPLNSSKVEELTAD